MLLNPENYRRNNMKILIVLTSHDQLGNTGKKTLLHRITPLLTLVLKLRWRRLKVGSHH